MYSASKLFKKFVQHCQIRLMLLTISRLSISQLQHSVAFIHPRPNRR